MKEDEYKYIDKSNYYDKSYYVDNLIEKIDYNNFDSNNIDLNKLGNYNLSDSMQYALELYILYCDKFGYDPSKVIKYVIDNSINNSNVLFASNDKFKKWVLINYGMKDIYVRHLKDLSVDLSSNNVIELYKGKLDSIMPRNNQISPYASTFNDDNSILYKKDNIIYRVDENSFEKISDGKTYLIQNISSVAHLLYILETLGKTDNKAIVTFWGNINDNNKNKLLLMMNEILEFLNMDTVFDLKTKFKEKDGKYIYSFIINTKSIKRDVDLKELLTIKEMNLLTEISKSKQGRHIK